MSINVSIREKGIYMPVWWNQSLNYLQDQCTRTTGVTRLKKWLGNSWQSGNSPNGILQESMDSWHRTLYDIKLKYLEESLREWILRCLSNFWPWKNASKVGKQRQRKKMRRQWCQPLVWSLDRRHTEWPHNHIEITANLRSKK